MMPHGNNNSSEHCSLRATYCSKCFVYVILSSQQLYEVGTIITHFTDEAP